jgi:hypothetical protein
MILRAQVPTGVLLSLDELNRDFAVLSGASVVYPPNRQPPVGKDGRFLINLPDESKRWLVQQILKSRGIALLG